MQLKFCTLQGTKTWRGGGAPVVGATDGVAARALEHLLPAVVLLGGPEPHASAARVHPKRWDLETLAAAAPLIAPLHLHVLQ